MSDIDNDKVGALVGKMLGDLGGAFSVPTARIGFRLGLFDALHRHGAARISELAGRTGLAERYVREWAFAQAANGYIAFDAEQEQFSLTPEQAMVFAKRKALEDFTASFSDEGYALFDYTNNRGLVRTVELSASIRKACGGPS